MSVVPIPIPVTDEISEKHCRLCAEPTHTDQLISIDDEVGQHSKITCKLLWINIDVTPTNVLPKSICYSCLDQLERTWIFLHNVRLAQNKLHSIYVPSNGSAGISEECAKPVNTDWEQFIDSKNNGEAESSPESENKVSLVNVSVIKEEPVDLDDVKAKSSPESENKVSSMSITKDEPLDLDLSSQDFNNFGSSSDSDLPLKCTSKKKKVKTKRKKKKFAEITIDNLDGGPNDEFLDMSMFAMTWDDYKWCCANCDAQCKTIDSLRLHSSEIHNRCCSYKCTDCGKVVSSYKTFVNHVKVHYKSLRHHCDICNKQFKTSSMVQKHQAKAHCEAYNNMCRSCGTNFETPELLQDHLIAFSRIIKYTKIKQSSIEMELKCDICNREFKSRSNLQAHKLVHTQRCRNFSCHMCGKMFYTKGALSTHMTTHEDLKPFKCPYCSLAFKARGNLTSHISLHSGAKPFVCEQCGKSFRVKRHLKSHSIIHTDLKPYVCSYCNKAFRFKTRLNLHVRQHTGAKPYTCVYCRRDFTNGSNYKKHMKRRHNVDTSVRKKYENSVVEQTQTSEENRTDTQNNANHS